MRLQGDQVVYIVVLVILFGFVALTLFDWAAQSTAPSRSWTFVFAGLYVVGLLAYAVLSILTRSARAERRARWSVRQRTREIVAWFLLALAVLLTVAVLGFFAGTPAVMEILLGANIGLLVGWLLLLGKVRRLADSKVPRG